MRGSFGLGGLRFFRLNCANVAFGLFGCSAQKKKKKNICLIFFNILGIIKGHLVERFIIPLRVE